MIVYRIHGSFIISSAWDGDNLTEIVVGSNDRLWEGRVSHLQSPEGMDPQTFDNFLKQVFLFDTSAMMIHTLGNDLHIECNHTADGFTFTFASFKLEPTTRIGGLPFYQNAIMELVQENIQKTRYASDLEAQMKHIEKINEELQQELKEETLKNMRDSAALTTVFKRIVNAKKRKIRALTERTIE